MIFLDANFILRFLVGPVDSGSEQHVEIARSVFQAAANGEAELTTTEVVLHEVAFILTSKKHYGMTSVDAAMRLATMLRSPSMRLPRGDKQRFLRAIDLWSTHPSLGLADCIVASSAMIGGHELATFDRGFDRIDELKRWQPSSLDS